MSADTSSASVAGNPGGEFPRAFYPIIRAIDRFTDVTGKLIAMSMLFLVVTISYEVVMRYGFGAPTVWVYESSFMVNGAAFMLGSGYALLKGAHVRTDIYWENYSERKKGIVDLISYLLFFYPAMITFMLISMTTPCTPMTPANGRRKACGARSCGRSAQRSRWRPFFS